MQDAGDVRKASAARRAPGEHLETDGIMVGLVGELE